MVAEVGSTNDLARRIARLYLDAEQATPPLVVVARRQTAGRGRRGRDWLSPADVGIYTSLLLPVTDPRVLAALPLQVPLALCEALDELGVDCRIKWPNDLLVGGRKLGGILIESLAGRVAVVGYGINGGHSESSLPTPEATSLRLATGRAPVLSRLAIDLAGAVVGRLAEGGPTADLVEAYRQRSVHRPGETMNCRVGDERLTGSFAGFDDVGRLRLDTPDGERLLGSAELLAEETDVTEADVVTPQPR